MFADVRNKALALLPRVWQLGRQAFIFGVVGFLAFLVDYAVLRVAVWLGLSPYLGRVLSIGVAIVFTWLLNRRITFAATVAPSWREFVHYVAISIFGAVINYSVFSVATFLKAPLLLGLALGTLCGMTFNFVRYRALLGRPER